jgi:hypothetical protein
MTMSCGFQSPKKPTIEKFKWWWFGSYQIWYCLPNNIVLLVAINKFNPHPIRVNVNKLNPYQIFTVSWGWEIGVQRGGDPDEQLEWNEDKQFELEDDTQLEVDCHLEQFVDNELEVDNDPVIAPPK